MANRVAVALRARLPDIRLCMGQITICCDVKCAERFSCQKFSRAMDVNGGKITSNYTIVECTKFNQYEK